MINSIHYKDVFLGTIYIDIDGSIVQSRPFTKLNWADVKGKTAYYSPDFYYDKKDLLSFIRWKTRGNRADYNRSDPVKLFISPKCKMPRDLYRNSGYKIVLDKDKADFIIIPEMLQMPDASSMWGNIAFMDSSGSLYVADIQKYGVASYCPSPEEIEQIREYLCSLFIFKTSLFLSQTKKIILFCSKCQEYEDILTGNTRNSNGKEYVYVSESNVILKHVHDINLTTLKVWSAMSIDLLAKELLLSNYKEYPFTITAFLNAEHPAFSYSSDGSKILSIMGLDGRLSNMQNITKKDYDMLISYVLDSCGLPPTGGYMTLDKFENMSSKVSQFLRKRVYVRPAEFEDTLSVDLLKSLAKN